MELPTFGVILNKVAVHFSTFWRLDLRPYLDIECDSVYCSNSYEYSLFSFLFCDFQTVSNYLRILRTATSAQFF